MLCLAQGELSASPEGGFVVRTHGEVRVTGDVRVRGSLSVNGLLRVGGDLLAPEAHFGAKSEVRFEGGGLHRADAPAPNLVPDGLVLAGDSVLAREESPSLRLAPRPERIPMPAHFASPAMGRPPPGVTFAFPSPRTCRPFLPRPVHPPLEQPLLYPRPPPAA